jgi:type II secretory pathway component GspD/PulD (secretin)
MDIGSQLKALIFGLFLIMFMANHAPGQGMRTDALTKIPAQVTEQKGNYQNIPLSGVIDLLEQFSGKHYIRDANLNGLPPVSINATGLGNDDTVKLITATLLLNGVAILPVDDRTMKVVTAGTNKNPRSEGLRLYTKAADLPADDEVVAYYMPLDNIRPDEAIAIFAKVAPVHVYGAYVTAPSANAVVLTENASVIRELIQLKSSIDIRNTAPPRPPGPPPPDAPSGPRPHGPPLGLFGLVVFALLIVIASATGSFFAQLWLGRRGPSRS